MVKSTTPNDNGTNTYTLSATINLVNRSQNLTPEGVEAFKTNFVSQMKESFGGTVNNGDKIEVEILILRIKVLILLRL